MLGNTEDEGDLGIIGQDSELLVSDLTWLKSVSEAVERIDNGNYGECVSCGEDIDEETLAALPWVAFCLRCAIQRHKELEEPLRQALKNGLEKNIVRSVNGTVIGMQETRAT